MPTLCLSMIVKNESKIITRLLDSVIGLIDVFVICDTGSTDNTKEILVEYFKDKNIKGVLKDSVFTDFETNRNEVLKLSMGFTDYILLLDADMVLHLPKFDKNKLTKDLYFILQGDEKYLYKNTRIIKNDPGFYYKGSTHEVILSDRKITTHTFDKETIYIEDIGDGGCKKDKLTRDRDLLIKSIDKEPNDSRNYFYLANTFFAMEEFENAKSTYERRIIMKGWKEEIWYSYYRLGLCCFYTNKISEGLFYFMEAFEINPHRIENLYYIVKYYLEIEHYTNALVYYQLAKQNKQNSKEFLFMEKDIYEYKLDNMYLKMKK